MRYNNKIYTIQSSNLNNSLVFYHALLDRMPIQMDASSMTFEYPDFILIVREREGGQSMTPHLHLKVNDPIELEAVNERMRRFRPIAQLNNECEVLDRAIGLMDPDGNKWVIGDPNTEVQFEKCYIKQSF